MSDRGVEGAKPPGGVFAGGVDNVGNGVSEMAGAFAARSGVGGTAK
jgi:hypothetical protein